MESALEEFYKGRTTMAQSQEVSDPDHPILIACPDPPFKQSFFYEQRIGFFPWFWASTDPRFSGIRKNLEKVSSMKNLYSNMSYKLGQDWHIYLVNQKIGFSGL